MIDLTPLDVRNKRGDFKKGMRGYDPHEVDVFLELVAERLEALVRENIQLRDRTQTLQEQVEAQTGREQAVQDALVTAQELREDIRAQSQREADHVIREAESEARRMIAEADAEVRSRLRGVQRQLDHARDSLQELERRRSRFLQEFRSLLQRELDVVEVEEGRTPLEERAIDLDLGAPRTGSARDALSGASAAAGSGAGGGDAPGSDATGDAPHRAASGEPQGEEGSGSVAEAQGAAETTGGHAPSGEGNPSARAGLAATAEPDVAAPSDVAGGPGADASSSDMERGAAPGGSPEAVAGASSDSAAVLSEEGRVALDADVGELSERGEESEGRPKAPPPEVGDAPSSLELELMAGAAGTDTGEESVVGNFPDVPDLETVLAEAGIDEVKPPEAEEISPPPPEAGGEDRLALFEEDSDEDEEKR